MARIEAEREAGVHFRPGYEYGPGPEDLQYGLYGPDGAPFYNYLGPEDAVPEPPFPNAASHPWDRAPGPESPLQPSGLQPRYVASHPGLCGCDNGDKAAPRLLHLHLPHLLVPASRGGGGERRTEPSPQVTQGKGQPQVPTSDPHDSLRHTSTGDEEVRDTTVPTPRVPVGAGDDERRRKQAHGAAWFSSLTAWVCRTACSVVPAGDLER